MAATITFSKRVYRDYRLVKSNFPEADLRIGADLLPHHVDRVLLVLQAERWLRERSRWRRFAHAEHSEAMIETATAGYMLPEQAVAKPVDWDADIWAFGAVLTDNF